MLFFPIQLLSTFRKKMILKNILTKTIYLKDRLYKLPFYKNLRISIKVYTIKNTIDYFILIIVILALVGDFIYLVSSIFNHLNDFFNLNGFEFINNMAEGSNSVSANTNTTTTTTTTTRRPSALIIF